MTKISQLQETEDSSFSTPNTDKQLTKSKSPVELIKELTKKRHIQVLLVFIVFGIIALAANWPIYPLDTHMIPNGGTGDLALSTWYLAWAPFAVLHHLNPYNTTWLNYPVGANLAINTQYFLYGLLLSPITYTLNAIASYNLLIWLAYPLSGTAMFWVTRRYVNHFWPSFVAGLFYGFSPYIVGEGLGHVNLMFIPFPPLIFCALYEIFTNHEHRYRWGVALSLFIIFQYMMSSEILASTAMISLISLMILAIANPNKIKPALTNAAGPIFISIIISLAVLFYPIWYSIDGPQHLVAPVQNPMSNPFRADLLGVILPTNSQKLYPASWRVRGSSLLQLDLSENGSYLGIPMLILLTTIGIKLWKNRWIRFFLIMSIIAWIISLGPYLTIDSHITSIPLPFDIITSIPIFNNMLPSRISMYSDLFIALTLAFSLNQLYKPKYGYSKIGSTNLLDNNSSRTLSKYRVGKKEWGLTILGIIVFLSLVPGWPYDIPLSTSNIAPSFFTSKQVDEIPNKAIVLTYPYPSPADDEPMVWQLLARMRFRLLGGYSLFTTAQKIVTPQPAELSPPQVQSAFTAFADGPTQTYPILEPPSIQELAPKLLHQFIHNNHVQVIIVNLELQNAPKILFALEQAFGTPNKSTDGLAIWILHK